MSRRTVLLYLQNLTFSGTISEVPALRIDESTKFYVGRSRRRCL